MSEFEGKAEYIYSYRALLSSQDGWSGSDTHQFLPRS
jgi:hypothetical protein